MEKENNFKPGDIVKLKSGGPKMTICSINKEKNTAYCAYFTKNNMKEVVIECDTLKKAKSN